MKESVKQRILDGMHTIGEAKYLTLAVRLPAPPLPTPPLPEQPAHTPQAHQ